MNFELIEKSSAAGASVARAATYAAIFMSVCVAWTVVDVILLGRFDPKFGRGGSVAAQVLIYGAAVIGATVVALLFRRRTTTVATAIQAAASALLVLTLWRIRATHSLFESVLDRVGAGGNLILLPVVIGAIASSIVMLIMVLATDTRGRSRSA